MTHVAGNSGCPEPGTSATPGMSRQPKRLCPHSPYFAAIIDEPYGATHSARLSDRLAVRALFLFGPLALAGERPLLALAGTEPLKQVNQEHKNLHDKLYKLKPKLCRHKPSPPSCHNARSIVGRGYRPSVSRGRNLARLPQQGRVCVTGTCNLTHSTLGMCRMAHAQCRVCQITRPRDTFSAKERVNMSISI